MIRKLLQLFRSEKITDQSEEEITPEFDPHKMPIVVHSKYDQVEFLNKQCQYLDDFIISEEINAYDLQKLADLNRFDMEIQSGWYPLVIELIKELNNLGWNKQVSCIKQKYASLRFYIDEPFDEIIELYEERSKYICEVCSEKGMQRDTGWEQVLCRKHYLESKRTIGIEEAGFRFEDASYKWSDIREIRLDGLDHLNRYQRVELTFQETVLPGSYNNELVVFHSTRGFGKFLQTLPIEYKPANFRFRNYIKDYFSKAEFCEICGYEAVFDDKCECCEYYSWHGIENKLKLTVYTRDEYLKDSQMDWVLDEGEQHEASNEQYRKNPEYKLLFTEKELEKWNVL